MNPRLQRLTRHARVNERVERGAQPAEKFALNSTRLTRLQLIRLNFCVNLIERAVNTSLTNINATNLCALRIECAAGDVCIHVTCQFCHFNT